MLGAVSVIIAPPQAVLALIHQTHPDFFSQKRGGDTWANDLSSNSFTAITPNLHSSLLAARDKRHKLGDNGAHLWGMGPEELAEAISFNLNSYGKPRFVDFTIPEEPFYSFQPPTSFEKVLTVSKDYLPDPVSIASLFKLVLCEGRMTGLGIALCSI